MHAHERSALVDWSKLPDLGAVGLLTVAFASVARHGRKSVSTVWLTAWLLIALHFAAFAFLGAPGNWASLASFIGLAALACAGVLFMWATVPSPQTAALQPLDAHRPPDHLYALSGPPCHRSRRILGSDARSGPDRRFAARHPAPHCAQLFRHPLALDQSPPSTWAFRSSC